MCEAHRVISLTGWSTCPLRLVSPSTTRLSLKASIFLLGKSFFFYNSSPPLPPPSSTFTRNIQNATTRTPTLPPAAAATAATTPPSRRPHPPFNIFLTPHKQQKVSHSTHLPASKYVSFSDSSFRHLTCFLRDTSSSEHK